MKKIYIVLSQTGTLFSRVLKLFTGAKFNHSSISLDGSLTKMYSFGRLNPKNPFIGGFVEEGKDKGTFKRFQKTKALVFEVDIEDDKYHAMVYFIEHLLRHKNEFHYNYLGVFFAIFKKNFEAKKRFYCSQFVKVFLQCFKVENSSELPKIIKPIDFLKLNNKTIIYEGLLQNYKA